MSPRDLLSAARRPGVVLLYCASVCLVAALLPVQGPARGTGQVVAALTLQVLLGIALMLTARHPASRARGCASVLVYLASVALLRDGVGATGGYGSLVLLPVLWAALEDRRLELSVSVAGVAAVYLVPLIAVGAPEYPSTGLRTAALMTPLAAVIGGSVLALIGRMRHEAARREAELAAIVAITRALGRSGSDNAREVICEVAIQRTGAADAAIWEPSGPGISTVCVGSGGIPGMSLLPAYTEHGAFVAWTTGQPLFVADATSSPHVQAEVARDAGAASVYFHPITDAAGTVGVLALWWGERRDALPEGAAALLDVLAGEAAAAIERADLLRRLDDLSRTDPLTGLPNRRAWEELLHRQITLDNRAGRPLSVAVLDLDHFKSYNDVHGHAGGDRVLRAAARIWQDALRKTDVLARWGGEEFVVLLPGCDAEEGRCTIERLSGLLPDGVTFSAGIATSHDHLTPDGLLEAADRALYRAKGAGRDCVAVA